jgi:hypothetical protein
VKSVLEWRNNKSTGIVEAKVKWLGLEDLTWVQKEDLAKLMF